MKMANVVKKVVKKADNALKKEVKKRAKNIKKVPAPSRKLYTDKEKEKLKDLRKEKAKIKKQMGDMGVGESTPITIKDLYHEGLLSMYLSTKEELAAGKTIETNKTMSSALGSLLSQLGVFNNGDPKYDEVDFREVLKDNPDEAKDILDDIEKLRPSWLEVEDPQVEEFRKETAKIDAEIGKIRERALKRKKDRKLKYEVDKIQAKQDYDDVMELIDRIDEGRGIVKNLSRGEQGVIDEVKLRAARAISERVKAQMGSDPNADPNEVNRVTQSVHQAISVNPKEGVRVFIRETVVGDVVKKYGNDAGDLARSMIDVATGKGSLSGIGLSMFKGVVNKSGFNEELMKEKAEELINAGKSTPQIENMKKLGRDVVIDIAKNVIKSGGNIYAAIPGVMKDILFDTGKSLMKDVKSAKNTQKPKKAAKNTTKALTDDEINNKFFVE